MKHEEFNFSSAKYAFPELNIDLIDGQVVCIEEDGRITLLDWNPYHNANDRNKVIEKMKIGCGTWNGGWKCVADVPRGFDSAIAKSMEAAQIACITKVLEALRSARIDK